MDLRMNKLKTYDELTEEEKAAYRIVAADYNDVEDNTTGYLSVVQERPVKQIELREIFPQGGVYLENIQREKPSRP
jgi:hypothetical protein